MLEQNEYLKYHILDLRTVSSLVTELFSEVASLLSDEVSPALWLANQ